MGSASNGSTQAMTSQQRREWEEDAAKERKRVVEQQAKSPQRPGSAKVKPPTTEPPRTELPDTESSDIESPDFLYLIPTNETAKLAFSELLDQKKAQKLSPHHFQYIVETGKGPLHKTVNYQARSKSETPEVEDLKDPRPSDINLGYFRVSFDCQHVTKSVSWVIGRGSAKMDKDKRDVDILLAVPGSIHTRGLRAAHAYLRMHPESGVWMIHAAPEYGDGSGESTPMVMATLDDQDILEGGYRCLQRPEARLSILDMEFRVQFALTDYSACDSYRDSRNRKLEEENIPVPDTEISGIPLESDIRARSLAVFSVGLSSGTFGSVYEAFDPESGDLRIVKVIELKQESVSKSLRPELAMVEEYPNARGLVRQYGWCNSNGESTLEAKRYPICMYIVQRKGEAFHKHSWQAAPGKGMEILKLCQDLLHGLHTIHQAGWMHRDITRQNILYFKGNPPEAALCDFGKLYRGTTHTSPRIAAWNYLPPEIVEGASNPYNQSLDIWMLALALLFCWYRRVFKDIHGRSSNGQLTLNNIGVIRARLAGYTNDSLAFLLRDMISEHPGERPSAKKALEYPCFQLLKAHAPPEAESSKGKRRHRDEDSIDIQAIKEQANRAE